MTDEEKNQDVKNDETTLKEVEWTKSTNQMEEEKSRDWRRYILGFAVILVAVIIWYLLDLFL